MAPGQEFGRYTIIRPLGVGGMGAVYQAWDQELGVVVAVKVIKPEAIQDPAAAQDLERRFKRELLLARTVTHKNVVRIHDIGDIGGIKYITMPYVHGSDLATELKRNGKLPVRRALQIAREVVGGLVAAHQAGVVHRDLKPANIMLDENDRAMIMDFGIARSQSDGGGTVGVVMGTLEYMAPEQARGGVVDHRADIYAFGLILFDMLVGRRAETGVTELMSRMQHAPPSVRSIDATIPEPLDRIVAACVNPDPAGRYQKTEDLAADLESLDQDGHPAGATMHTRPLVGAAIPLPQVRKPTSVPVKWLGVGAAALVTVAAAAYFGPGLIKPKTADSPTPAVATGETVSLAILPFRNASGDASLSWLGANIPETLRADIGQSQQLRTVPPDRLYQLLKDLRIETDTTFDSTSLGRIAEFASSDVVLWGQYLKFGDEIRIDATLQDVKHQRSIPLKAQAAGEAGLLPALDQLAQSVRENLSLSRKAVEQLKATSLQPSSKSLPALRYYNEGLGLVREGKYVEAVKKFEASTQEDKDFALAQSKLAQVYSQLGYAKEAEQASQKAVSLSASLPDAEKYLIQASSARILKDHDKAIEGYEKVAKMLPGNDEVLFDLSELYEETASLDRARDGFNRLVQRDPKAIDALFGLGRVEIKRGNTQVGLEVLTRALNIAIQRENEEAKATVLEWIGVAYRVLDKPDEALRNYNEALDINRRIGRKLGVAQVVHEIGKVEQGLGKQDMAARRYQEALALYKEIGDNEGVAKTLLNVGILYQERSQFDQALGSYKESLRMHREQGNENDEGLVLSHIGDTYFLKGDYDSALTYLQQALAIRERIKNPDETADTIYTLAETYSKMGRYDEALKSYLRVLELRRSVNNSRGAAEVSFSMSALYGQQGRFGAAVSSGKEAVDIFRGLKEKSSSTIVILNAYGNALSQIGRGDEAQPILEEALGVARELKNDALASESLNYQGDRFFYAADFKAARPLYEQALQAATRARDQHAILLSKINAAKIATKDGRPQVAISSLKGLAADADKQGLRYLSVASSIYLAEALISTKQYARAGQELELAITDAEKLGLRVRLAQGHYLIATVLTQGGDAPGARRHLEQAKRLLEEIRKEAKTDDVLKRSDLAPILAAGQ